MVSQFWARLIKAALLPISNGCLSSRVGQGQGPVEKGEAWLQFCQVKLAGISSRLMSGDEHLANQLWVKEWKFRRSMSGLTIGKQGCHPVAYRSHMEEGGGLF